MDPLKVEVKEDEEDSNLVLLGIQSVYNNNEELGLEVGELRISTTTTATTKENPTIITTQTNSNHLLVKLKCTGWRCKKCGQDFPSQSDIITHVQQKSCTQVVPNSTKLTTTPAAVAPVRKKKEKPEKENESAKVASSNSNSSKPSRKTKDKEEAKARIAAAPTPRATSKRISSKNLTPEEASAAKLKRKAECERLRRARMSEEKRAEIRRKNAEAQRLRRMNLSEEELKLRRKKDAEAQRLRLQKLSEEERELMRRRDAERHRLRLQNLSEEERELVRRRDAEGHRVENLSLEQLVLRRRRHAEAQKRRDICRRTKETEEEAQKRRQLRNDRNRVLKLTKPTVYQARRKRDNEQTKLRERVKESEKLAALIEQMTAAGSSSLENPNIPDNIKNKDNNGESKLSQWTLAAMLDNIKIIPSSKTTTTTTTSTSINQDSEQPMQCSICKKDVPLKYMQYHFNYHAELEFEETGIWREPQRLNDIPSADNHLFACSEEREGKDATAADELLLFNCSSCNSSFSQEFVLQMHVRQAHESSSPSSSQLNCSTCHKTFKDMATLNKHTNKVHSSNNTIVKVKL